MTIFHHKDAFENINNFTALPIPLGDIDSHLVDDD